MYNVLVFNGAHLFAGEAAAIVAPAGGAEEVMPFLPPSDVFAGKVFGDGVPFVEYDVDGAFFIEGFGEAVFGGLVFFIGQFGLEGSEELVPDDEEHAHVLIEVFGIGGVVDAVMRWGDKDVFQPAHFIDEFGVNEYAPDLGGGVHENDVHGFEAQEGEGYEVYEAIERLKDGGPESYGKIEMFGGVVGDVDGPEQADLVVPAVEPVIEEVLCEEEDEPV